MAKAEYCRFFDLAMKCIAGQSCEDEDAKLARIIGTDKAMEREVERLNRETQLLVALHPLLEGVLAEPTALPAQIRKKLQAGAKKTTGLLK